LLAHVIVSKYCDHLPLYRQEATLGRLGWEVTRSTLCDQILACAGVLEPLYRLMRDRVRLSAALHTDDTPVPLLAPRRTAHAWVYVGDAANPYTVFDLSVGRVRVEAIKVDPLRRHHETRRGDGDRRTGEPVGMPRTGRPP
jgi:hypothetical protein